MSRVVWNCCLVFLSILLVMGGLHISSAKDEGTKRWYYLKTKAIPRAISTTQLDDKLGRDLIVVNKGDKFDTVSGYYGMWNGRFWGRQPGPEKDLIKRGIIYGKFFEEVGGYVSKRKDIAGNNTITIAKLDCCGWIMLNKGPYIPVLESLENVTFLNWEISGLEQKSTSLKQKILELLEFGSDITSVAAADFNHDGWEDLAITSGIDRKLYIMLGDGKGNFVTPNVVKDKYHERWQTRSGLETIKKFYKIYKKHKEEKEKGGIKKCAGNTLYEFTFDRGRQPTSVVAGDFNNDGTQDLVVGFSGVLGGYINIFLNQGGGTFDFPKEADATVSKELPLHLAKGDFNNDGNLDVVAAGEKDFVFLQGNGRGELSKTGQNYPSGYEKRGIAGLVVKDFDQNGALDIAIAEYPEGGRSGRVNVWLGNGDGTFVEPTRTNSIRTKIEFTDEPTGLVADDFDRDGDLDLAVTLSPSDSEQSKGHISVLLNVGEGDYFVNYPPRIGKFEDEYIPPVTSLGVGDFDGEKGDDLVVTHPGKKAENGSVTVMFNKNYTFKDTAQKDTEIYPVSIAIDNFDAKINDDLIIVNFGSKSVSKFFWKKSYSGRPKLKEPQLLKNVPPNMWPSGIAAGDINQDQCADIAVTDYANNKVYVYLNEVNKNCSGDFEPAFTGWYSTGKQPIEIILEDFNKDENIDLAILNLGSNDVTILLGRGDGTFRTTGKRYSVGKMPVSIDSGDFNGDGILDLAVANFGSNDISILKGKGDGTFEIYEVVAKKGDTEKKFNGPTSIVAADLEGQDDKDELAVANFFDNKIYILNYIEEKGDKLFFDVNKIIEKGKSVADMKEKAIKDGPTEIVTGDFDGDDAQDLAVAVEYPKQSKKDIFIIPNPYKRHDSSEKEESEKQSACLDVPTALTLANFDDNGHLDIAVANKGSDNISVFLGTQEGELLFCKGSFKVGKSPEAVIAGHFNDDKVIDLAVANKGSNSLSLLYGQGDGIFKQGKEIQVGARPLAFTQADFDGDGHDDLAVAGEGESENVTILLKTAEGKLGASQDNVTLLTIRGSPQDIASGDFNDDNHPDLAVVTLKNNRVVILLNEGDGNFAKAARFTVGEYPTSIFAEDFNRDGETDLVVTNSGSENPGNISLLIGDGKGDFVEYQGRVPTEEMEVPEIVISGDFDNEKGPDLAIGDTARDSVWIFLNNGNGHFSPQKEIPVGGYPSDMIIGDVDKDGNHDMVVVSGDSNELYVLLGDGEGGFSKNK